MWHLRFVVIHLLFLTISQLSHAQCDCIELSLSQYFDASDEVFVGQCVARSVNNQSQYEHRGLLNTFTIWHTLKGSLQDTVQILTGNGKGDGGFKFELGLTYVVFTRQRFVDSCSGAKLLEEGLWQQLVSIRDSEDANYDRSRVPPPPPPPSTYLTTLTHEAFKILHTNGKYSRTGTLLNYRDEDFLDEVKAFMSAQLGVTHGPHVISIMLNGDNSIGQLEFLRSDAILTNEQCSSLKDYLDHNFTYVTNGFHCLLNRTPFVFKVPD